MRREEEKKKIKIPQDTKGKTEAGAGSLLSRPSRKEKMVLGWIGVDWGWVGNLFFLFLAHMISSPQEHEGDEPGRQLQTERKKGKIKGFPWKE